MHFVIIALVLIGLGLAGRRWVERRNQPDRKLLRDFSDLRKSMLRRLPKDQRDDTERLLTACEAHLDALVAAKAQHELIDRMADSARQLTGQGFDSHRASATEFDERIAENLAAFFATLSQIARAIGLQEDSAVESLREFTEQLEDQRETLVKLELDLAQQIETAHHEAVQKEKA